MTKNVQPGRSDMRRLAPSPGMCYVPRPGGPHAQSSAASNNPVENHRLWPVSPPQSHIPSGHPIQYTGPSDIQRSERSDRHPVTTLDAGQGSLSSDILFPDKTLFSLPNRPHSHNSAPAYLPPPPRHRPDPGSVDG